MDVKRTFAPKSIGYFHDPSSQNTFQRPIPFDNDLILFSVTPEALSRISFDRISIIGGRSSSGIASAKKKFSDVIKLSDVEKELFINSLYRTSEKAIILPLKNKILVVYNQLLRSSGLGLAFIFDYSPKCLSALVQSGDINFESVLISPTFTGLPSKSDKSMDFLGSLSKILDCLKSSDSFSRFAPESDIKALLGIINSASNLTGCPISVELGDISSSNILVDRPTLMAFALCLLSKARRLSKDRRATVYISSREHFDISIEFTLSLTSDIDKDIAEADFCDRMANEMGVPFGIDINDGLCRASFIPFRADPSVLGFKAGIRIDGKRITRSI